MNPLHYPDLERCKKLKEIGFPYSEKTFWNSESKTMIKDREYGKSVGDRASIVSPCPSVMEMLDIIPPSVQKNSKYYHFTIDRCGDTYQITYKAITMRGLNPNSVHSYDLLKPGKYHEIISVFSYNKHNYFPIMWEQDEDKIDKRKTINQPEYLKDTHYGKVKGSRKKDTGMRFPKSVIKFDRGVNSNVHPTQKPVALIEYLIKTYTNELETVLDFTAGSFTTAVACENTNRKWICIEKDETYFNIGCKRVLDLLPKQ